jgi:hypothetical protein
MLHARAYQCCVVLIPSGINPLPSGINLLPSGNKPDGSEMDIGFGGRVTVLHSEMDVK